MPILSACVLALAAASEPTVRLPGGGRVAIELRADRDTYHVGEAVELTLTVKNVGDLTLVGYALLQPYLPPDLKSSLLSYCREDTPCVEFLGKIPNVEYMDMAASPITLAPGEQAQSQFVVAFNPAANDLVLGTPGDHEFRWVTWGLHERRGVGPRVRGQELSASAFVHVLPVPPAEQAAYAYYVEHGLAAMAQYDEDYFEYTENLRRSAHAMLKHFPSSIYADATRTGFRKHLESRARRGRATVEDQTVLADLRARAAISHE